MEILVQWGIIVEVIQFKALDGERNVTKPLRVEDNLWKYASSLICDFQNELYLSLNLEEIYYQNRNNIS